MVDLPQAFGPTITLTRPSGTASSRSWTTVRSSYASVSSRALSLPMPVPVLVPMLVVIFQLLRYGCE